MKEPEFREKCVKALETHFDELMSDFKDEGCGTGPIDSPIERMLYAALVTLRQVEHLSEGEPEKIGSFVFSLGLHISPQYKIGNYIADFLVSYSHDIYSLDREKTIFSLGSELVVECDGHEWHERDEKERRYEKARDRFMQSKGYKVFRFTGKEITDDPFNAASEIFKEVVGRAPNFID